MTNLVHLIGNLGRDPEIKPTRDDKRMMILQIATSNDYKKNGEWVSRDPDWHRVVVFNESVIARIEAAGFKSGSKVEVKASLKTHKFSATSTGEDRHSTDIVVQDRFDTVRAPEKKPEPSKEKAA